MLKNIYNNAMPVPTEWESTQNITEQNSWDLLQRLGFRRVPEQPALAEGYVRTSAVLVEGDGEWGVWEVVDKTHAQIDQEAAEAEIARQAAKPDALKAVEVRFLDLCQTLTGSREKAGFAALSDIIEQLMLADPQTATAASLRLLAIDAEGKREGGLHWWDDCADHPEVVQ